MLGGCGRGGRGPALLVLAVLLAIAAGAWPGSAPVGSAEHQPVAGWKLIDIVHRDNDERGQKAGLLKIEDVQVSAQGGSLRMTERWDEVCSGKLQRFRYNWRFPQNIEWVPKGATVGANISIDVEGGDQCNGAYTQYTYMAVHGDNDGSTAPRLAELSRYVGPSQVFKSIGNSYERFYADPKHGFHVAGPRTLQASDSLNNHFAWFKVYLTTRVGFGYDVVYVYEAQSTAPTAGGGGVTPPPGGGNPPTGGVTPPPGGGGSEAAVQLIGGDSGGDEIGCIPCDGKFRVMVPGRPGVLASAGPGDPGQTTAGAAVPGAGTLRNFRARVTDLDGGIWAFGIWRNGAWTGVGCSINPLTAPGQLECAATSSVHVDAGDRIAVSVGNPGDPFTFGRFGAEWSVEFVPDAAAAPAPGVDGAG